MIQTNLTRHKKFRTRFAWLSWHVLRLLRYFQPTNVKIKDYKMLHPSFYHIGLLPGICYLVLANMERYCYHISDTNPLYCLCRHDSRIALTLCSSLWKNRYQYPTDAYVKMPKISLLFLFSVESGVWNPKLEMGFHGAFPLPKRYTNESYISADIWHHGFQLSIIKRLWVCYGPK